MKIQYGEKIIETQKKLKVSDLLEEEIKNSKYEVVGCTFNNEYRSLAYKVSKDGEIKLINTNQKEGMNIYRRTLIYIMAKAFEELYPKSKLNVNYQLGNAMFCDSDNMKITDKVIENLEKRILEIVEQDIEIKRIVMNREEAEEFYKQKDNSKGRLQFNLEENKDIYIYYCEDYYNYCYGTLGNRTGITKIFKIEKYTDGFLVRYPSSKNPEKLLKEKDSKKIAWALNEYDDIHKLLGVNNVYKLNKAVEEDRIKDIIMLAEALHEKNIAKIADQILERKNVKMILIAGPSSSGKTTFAQRLGIQLRLNGIKPITISVDNYFVERQDTPRDENGEYDFECVEAVDLELFNNHLVKLLNGEEIEMPEFDFIEGTKRYNGKKLKLEEDEILVIEGIHCLNDRLTSQIAKRQKYKVYISALTVLNMDRINRISTTDTRLVRRIVRDFQFRGYGAKHTIGTWHKVNQGEAKNIFPFQEDADSIFNTSLVYELGVLKDIAMPKLKEITNNEVEYTEAQRLINMLKYFKSIPKEYVPGNSLLKEFIGEGNFKY